VFSSAAADAAVNGVPRGPVDQNGSLDEVAIYQSADGTVTLDVKTDSDTVWLS
jgi:hypothetical protein